MVYYKMTELSIEHILLFVVAAFLLYHLMGSYGCSGNGFRVGGQFDFLKILTPRGQVSDGSCPQNCDLCNCLPGMLGTGGLSSNCDSKCYNTH
jgi:hypothetical protein